MKIDKAKQYKTRNGLIVRIYATDGVNDSVHGAILFIHGWQHYTWSSDGKSGCADDNYDLIEIRPRIKRTMWINVYEEGVSAVGWLTKEKADSIPISRIACVRVDIDCEEGEGL